MIEDLVHLDARGDCSRCAVEHQHQAVAEVLHLSATAALDAAAQQAEVLSPDVLCRFGADTRCQRSGRDKIGEHHRYIHQFAHDPPVRPERTWPLGTLTERYTSQLERSF